MQNCDKQWTFCKNIMRKTVKKCYSCKKVKSCENNVKVKNCEKQCKSCEQIMRKFVKKTIYQFKKDYAKL